MLRVSLDILYFSELSIFKHKQTSIPSGVGYGSETLGAMMVHCNLIHNTNMLHFEDYFSVRTIDHFACRALRVEFP